MKMSTKLLSSILLLAVVAFTFASCSKNNDSKPTPRHKSYTVYAYGDFDVTGKVNFKEILNADSVMVTIRLQGKDISRTSSLSVEIKNGTSIEDGKTKLDLGNYDGSQNEMMEKVKMSYDDLVNGNYSLGVYLNNGDIVAQAELGTNATFKSYDMKNSDDMINGQLRVYKREKGSYLVIKLDAIGQDCEGKDHPVNALIDNKKDSTLNINPVLDSTLISTTELPDFEYKSFIKYSGSIKVYCSEDNLLTILSTGKFKK